MASGHVNRTNRPNTWLHRPATRREDSPCQLGAVHTWHLATNPARPLFWSLSGEKQTWPGWAKIDAKDPKRTWERI